MKKVYKTLIIIAFCLLLCLFGVYRFNYQKETVGENFQLSELYRKYMSKTFESNLADYINYCDSTHGSKGCRGGMYRYIYDVFFYKSNSESYVIVVNGSFYSRERIFGFFQYKGSLITYNKDVYGCNSNIFIFEKNLTKFKDTIEGVRAIEDFDGGYDPSARFFKIISADSLQIIKTGPI